MNNIIFGYIYCAIIDCYPKYVKVGCTSNITERMKNLSGQLVDKFICIFFIKVKYSQMFNIEKKIHKDIINAGYERINNKEFFKCKPYDIKYIFDKYDNYKNNKNYEKIVNTSYENTNIKKIISDNINYIDGKINYNCDICNFTSNKKTDYNNHLHTKKHINNITPKDKFCCNECLKIFNHYSSLYKHQKTCGKLIENSNPTNKHDDINNNDNTFLIENLLLKQEIKFLKEKTVFLEEKKEIESKLIRAQMEAKLNKEKTEKQLLKDFEKQKTKLIKQNNKQLLKSKDEQIDLVQNKNLESTRQAYSEGRMNALTFLTLSYNKTQKMPSLPKNSNYVVADVKSDKEISYWIKERPEFADEYIAERLLHIYEGKDFANYICNIVVKAYKTDDPAEQTFWASDVSRLIYIIRSTLNQKDEWVYDKKGVVIKESIIDPLLDEVYNIITKYYKYMNDRYLHSVIEKESDYYMKKLPVLRVAENLIKDFRNRQSIKTQIIKVLAPMFYLDRDLEKDIKKIKDKKNMEKQKQIDYQPPKIENNTIFDKIKQKKLEDIKQIVESSEDTEEFLNDPRVKYKMELQNKKIGKK